MHFDTIIKGGIIIGGTGNPRFQGDIEIIGAEIVTIGELTVSQTEKVINASNHIVAPGFVDSRSGHI